jgi:hypothetical protein
MYRAGYDIREAPYAWVKERGKAIKNPQQKGAPYVSPGYAAYSFAFMSEFYPGEDYSKLKRGDAEYAQFLKQLRRSDPSAFNPSQ